MECLIPEAAELDTDLVGRRRTSDHATLCLDNQPALLNPELSTCATLGHQLHCVAGLLYLLLNRHRVEAAGA